MLDKDKTWLICYVNVSHIHETDVPEYIQTVKQNFTYDDSVITITIPTYDAPRIEVFK